MSRSAFVVPYAAAACAVLLAVASAASAQTPWQPQRPVEIVVPTAAGGINDQLARLLQKIAQDRKAVPAPVLVMNKPGGNQSLAVVYLGQHPSDGHLLLYTTPTLVTNRLAGLTTIGHESLTPLALLFVEHTAITTRAGGPVKDMRALLDRLKRDPGSVAFGMVSRGGPNHIALAQSVRAAGIDARKLKIAIFKTNAESLAALAGGHLDAVASSISAALMFVQSGRARMLATTSPQRLSGTLAGVPTMAEHGVSGPIASNWRGIFGAPRLDAAQVAWWDETLARVVAAPEWRSALEANQLAPRYLRSSAFRDYVQSEYESTRVVMMDLGLAK